MAMSSQGSVRPIGASDGGVGDGRRRRREVNRKAVVEALASLHDEGHLDPTIDEIAARSGVSARSVFRYFADVDDLTTEAVALHKNRIAPLLDLEADLGDPPERRLDTFVRHRIRLLEAMGNTARVARLRMHEQPIIAAEVSRMRGIMRRQVAEVFAPELARLEPPAADRRLAALDVLASFESYRLWRDHQGLGPRQAARVLTEALRCLLIDDPAESGEFGESSDADGATEPNGDSGEERHS